MEWQHKIKKDILTGLYGNQPRWFLPSNAFSSKLIHIHQNKQHVNEFNELPLKLTHLFPRICLRELCKILNPMCFHRNPIFVSHPVNFHLNQYVCLRPAHVRFLEPQCSHRFRHHVCGSLTNAFQCNSANFPRHVFWFSSGYKVSYNCKCTWLQGKAGEVLPGLSGNTTSVTFLKPWYPTRALGACSTAIQEASATGRLSALTPDLLIQNLDPRKIPSRCVWTVKYEKRCVKTNSLTTIVISGVILKVFWVKRFFQWMESLMRQRLKPAYFIRKGIFAYKVFYCTHDSCIHFLLINSRIHLWVKIFFKLNHSGLPWWLKC